MPVERHFLPTNKFPLQIKYFRFMTLAFRLFVLGTWESMDNNWGSLSEPHTSEKLGTVVTYTNNYEKKRTFSIFGWYGRFTYTNNSDEKRTNSIFGWYDCSCRKR